MGLVDLQTDLTSLRYGKDTVGGGWSGQPYVTKNPPNDLEDISRTGGPDFLLRGGTLFPGHAIDDVSRLTKMFFDFGGSSIRGPLFIAKQNVLSLSNVDTTTGYINYSEAANTGGGGNEEASPQTALGRFIKNNLALNQGIYTPLSTLAAAAGVGLGIYPNKQGLNPFNPMQGASPNDVQTNPNGLTLPTYIQIINGDGTEGTKSRLLGFLPKMDKTVGGTTGANDLNLYSYTGGPGATLGVGKTNIDMLQYQRTGANNPLTLNSSAKVTWSVGNTRGANGTLFSPFGQFASNFNSNLTPSTPSISNTLGRGNTSYTITNINQSPTVNDESLNNEINNDQFLRVGASVAYLGNSFILGTTIDNAKSSFLPNGKANNQFSIYDNNNDPFSLITKIGNKAFKSGLNERNAISTWTHKELEQQPKNTGLTLESFETKVPEVDKNNQIPKSPSYVTKNIETRVNLGNPGKRGNIKSYSIGKNGTGVLENQRNALDKITAMPLYNSNKVTDSPIKNDLVKFRIGVIDNKDPNNKTYIHFRAFINGFSDNYSSNWSSQKFMGRAEEFYKYTGFDRSISMDWTVAAQSKQELIPMYQKLNYLASVCAPDYSDSGYMQGNLITLTVGGWCYEQMGIMEGINLEVPQDSPWEIAINDEGNYDGSVKELPMIINVSGFSFKPIHNFVPRVQQNNFAKGEWNKMEENFVNSFGQERYIGLTNGTNSNYDGNETTPNYQALIK